MTTTIYDNVFSTGSPWTTYVPTATSQIGALTAANATGRYKILGKTCFFQIQTEVVTAGTGSGELRATLPLAAATTASGYGFIVAGQLANNNNSLTAVINSSESFTRCLRYDGASIIADGNIALISGVYETA